MIELLLQAERALTVGMVDQAERMYWQVVEADSNNSIAVVGLARVALERGDDRTAYTFGRKALAIDPDNVAAQRLVARLAEVMAYRGETPPGGASGDPAGPNEDPAGASGDVAGPDSPERPEASAPPASDTSPAPPPADRSPGWFGRILRREDR